MGSISLTSLGGGTGESIATTTTGCVVVGATNSRNLKIDILVHMFGPDGKVLWQRAFGGKRVDLGRSVVYLADGAIGVLGYTSSFGVKLPSCWVVKLDARGQVIWTRVYSVDGNTLDPQSIIQTQDGGLAVAGSMNADNPMAANAFILKLDGQGNILWQRILKARPQYIYWGAASITELQNRGLAFTGHIQFNNEKQGCWVVNCSGNGQILFSRAYTTRYVGAARGICRDSSGRLIVVGNVASTSDIRHRCSWIIMLDPSGNVIWQRAFSTHFEREGGRSVVVLPDGTLCLVGSTDYPDGVSHCLITKVSPNGELIWASAIGEDRYHINGNGVTLGENKSLLISGFMSNKYDNKEMRLLLVKMEDCGLKSPLHIEHWGIEPVPLAAVDIVTETIDITPQELMQPFKWDIPMIQSRKIKSKPIRLNISP